MQKIDTVKLNTAAKKGLKYFFKIEEGMNELQTIPKYLLYLASKHPAPATFLEIEEILGVNKSQVSRVTRRLHRKSHRGTPGLDYLNIDFDLDNPRVKLVTLNDKGFRAIEVFLEPWRE